MKPDDILRALAAEADLIAEGERMIADARATIATARKMILMSEGRRVALEEMARAHGVELHLHSHVENATVNDTMNTETASRIRGQKLKSRNVAAKKIRSVDGSIAAFAAKRKVPTTTVRSWYQKGDAARKIPEKWAAVLEKAPYFIPRSAWTNGVDSDGD